MHVWLITVGEPLPTDNSEDRLLRTGILANMLLEKGHKVTWWTSSVDHVRKRQRAEKDTFISVDEQFRIILLHSVEYKENVSLKRIINHYGIARKFTSLSDNEQIPDIILVSLPTLELSCAAVEYGKKRKIPVILDIRDLWPEIFIELVPWWGESLVRVFLSPMFRSLERACTGATAIIGTTSSFVEWGINYGKRSRTILDKDFPMGYREVAPDPKFIQKAEDFWRNYGISDNKEEFIVCFFGSMGRHFELESVIQAARKLNIERIPIRFVLCGVGDNYEKFRHMASNCNNVLMPGWVGAAEIWSLMRFSSVGLAPYVDSKNFTLNLPNKPIEYLSAGLPVISNLKGVMNELVNRNCCGLTYKNRDPDDLADALKRLFNSNNMLANMSMNASSLYKSRFKAEKVYNDLIIYLESIVLDFK